MSKFMLLSALVLGGCTFTVYWPTEESQSEEVAAITDSCSDANETTGTDHDNIIDADDSTNSDRVESVDTKDCAENQYWEPHFNKCAFYPCCEIKGDWTFVFNDMSTFPWKPIAYSAKISQNKAYVKLVLTGAGTLALPQTLIGTLEKTTLHLDGENNSGFLTLDATDVKKQLDADKIEGDYVWLMSNRTNMVGTFYLQRP